MNRDKPCIEVENRPMHNRHVHSVKTYDAALFQARGLSPRALAFHRLVWAVAAPPVHTLTAEWQMTREAQVRVTNPDLYHAQMLELMGLGDLAKPTETADQH